MLVRGLQDRIRAAIAPNANNAERRFYICGNKAASMIEQLGHLEYIAEQIETFGIADETAVCSYLNHWHYYALNARREINTQFYLESYRDVSEAGIEPLSHFIEYGFAEGRRPHPLIFTNYIKHMYDLSNNDIKDFFAILEEGALINPLVARPIPFAKWHSLLADRASDIPGLFYFDYEQWLRQQTDVRVGYPRHPVEHLFRYGLAENRLSSTGAIDPRLVHKGRTHTEIGDDLRLVESARAPLKCVSFRKLQIERSPICAANGARVAVGVVFYRNSQREVRRIVASIKRALTNGRASISTLALDNTPDPVIDILEGYEREFDDAMVIQESNNIGFSRGHNLLMEHAFSNGADYYAGLNPDGFLLDDAIDNAVSFSAAHGNTSLIEIGAFPIGHPKWHHPVTGETAWMSGAAFLVPRRIFESIGGFDPDFPMYGEDVDYSLRARLAGFSVRVAPRAQFYHDVVQRLGRDSTERQLRQLIGNWYLCKKWRQEDRAEQFRAQIDRIARESVELPSVPLPLDPTPDISADLAYPRYAPSRFWGD